MKTWLAGLFVAGGLAASCGCETMRAIDQWKCDHLGWCCFGVRPSAPPCAAPLPAPVTYAPAGDCGPACPSPCAPTTTMAPAMPVMPAYPTCP